MIRRALPSILSSAVLAFAAGCSSTETPPSGGDAASDAVADVRLDAPRDGASEAGDGGACTLVKPYSSKNAVCNQCAQAKCCAEINGCLGDPKCDDDYVNCILACSLLPPDGGSDAGAAIKACIDQCGVEHPQGKAAYDVAIGCADTKCAVECQ
jgi:hypothetical protein